MADTCKATFGAGCFWGVEARFRALNGVLDAPVGYMGGTLEQPTYRDVCRGDTGHAEVVQVHFDPDEIDYESLLDAFFGMHNPTTRDRQGPDVGSQYRSVIFYHDDAQKTAAEKKISELDDSGRFPAPIVTQVAPAAAFWRAEEYHQRYLEKHGGGHCAI